MTGRPTVALVGTGNFALNLASLLTHFGVKLKFAVDEFRSEPFQGAPVFQAADLPPAQLGAVDKFIIAISHPEHADAAEGRLRGRGIEFARIIRVSDDPALQILRLLFEQFGSPAVDAFCRPGVTSLPELESRFLAGDWQQTLARLDASKTTIGLCYYGRGGGFRRHLSPLIPLLEERFNLLTLSDEMVGGDGEIPGRHLFIGSESACRRRLFDLALSAHVFPCSPHEVPRVTFSHVIYDFNLTPDYHAERIAQSDTHYMFASSQASFDWYARLIREKRLRNRLCVIPGGYLHLDENIRLAQAYRGPVDSIIYAPTLSLADYPHCDLATSMAEGAIIVERLLEAFPGHRIIFRPHPSDLKLFQLKREDARSRQFARLLELCRAHPRCILDDNPTSYMDSYNRAALMVSDTSSTAMTFAFATGRPVVFYAPRNDELIATLGDQLTFVRDREQVGVLSASPAELESCVEQQLQKGDKARETLENFRDRVLFNVGKSGAYFAENIDYILRGEKHPHWLYFNW